MFNLWKFVDEMCFNIHKILPYDGVDNLTLLKSMK